jgi:hypothetical protein
MIERREFALAVVDESGLSSQRATESFGNEQRRLKLDSGCFGGTDRITPCLQAPRECLAHHPFRVRSKSRAGAKVLWTKLVGGAAIYLVRHYSVRDCAKPDYRGNMPATRVSRILEYKLRPSLEPGVFGLGLLEDRDIGVSIFP